MEKDLQTLIYDMLRRQRHLMIDKIMPRLERVERAHHRQQKDIVALQAAVDQLQKDVALVAGALYQLRTGKPVDEDVRPN